MIYSNLRKNRLRNRLCIKFRGCEILLAKGTKMKGLETGKDKIQKICDALRKETLEPAKQEAREIVENGHLRAQEIVVEAEKKSQKLLQEAQKEIEERKRVFQASLQLACKQGIEQLKQKLEEELFNKELANIVEKEMGEPKVIAHLIQSFIRSLEEKGVEEELTAVISKTASPRAISSLLAERVLEKLENQVIAIGDFAGGVQVRLKGKQITIDLSDTVVKELIGQYIRRDFRDLVFNV